MSEAEQGTGIPVGTPIIYYNLWTGFETTAFQGQFKQLTAGEIQQLDKGDVVYVDIDPLHPQGKVYGRIKSIVTMVEPVSGSEVRIHYRGGSWSGFKTTRNGLCHTIFMSTDEGVLAKIVAENPKSQVIDPRNTNQ